MRRDIGGTTMHKPVRHLQPRRSAIALGLLAVFGPALAQDAPQVFDASVTVGAGLTVGDKAERGWFGQYNGLHSDDKAVGVLDLSYYRRNLAAGTQVDLSGTSLLNDTRELSLRWQRQGFWKVRANAGELTWSNPYTVRTGLVGAGSATPTVTPVAPGGGAELDLKLKRTSAGVGLWTALSPRVGLDISLKSEDKTGMRLFGVGVNCPSTITPGCRGANAINTGWALLMLPEPVNATHSQIEARLSYAGESLNLSAGYYASFYNNSYGALAPSVPGSLNNALGDLLPLNIGLQALLNLPIALPPDNEAHQFDITGNYRVTGNTQLRFKLAYGRAEQHQDFAAAGFTDAPSGVANLGGRVDTTLAQVGVSSRPLARLTLVADVRYEDKQDKTPLASYNLEGPASGANLRYTNLQLPNRRTRAKLQASYQFSSAVKGSLGANYEEIDRGVFTASSAVAGISALRQQTDETRVHAELRRLMTESLSASLGVESSLRRGSNWLKPNSGTGVTEVLDPQDPALGFAGTAIFMPTLADRRQDKVKLRANWQPKETLSFQVSAEDGQDRYQVTSLHGLRKSGTSQLSIDASYAPSDKWNMTGYVSQSVQSLHQSRAEGYILSYKSTDSNVGVGVTAHPIEKVELGAGLNWAYAKNVYSQSLDSLAPPDSVALLASTGGLPDVIFRQASLKLFGKAEIDERSSARIDLVHQRSRSSDWAWGYNGVPFAYSDGSTLSLKPLQSVTVVAVSYTLRWK